MPKCKCGAYLFTESEKMKDQCEACNFTEIFEYLEDEE